LSKNLRLNVRDAEPAKTIENVRLEFFLTPSEVGIFKSEVHSAAMVRCKKIIEQRRAGASNMEIAGR
jgi:hypothetical protein